MKRRWLLLLVSVAGFVLMAISLYRANDSLIRSSMTHIYPEYEQTSKAKSQPSSTSVATSPTPTPTPSPIFNGASYSSIATDIEELIMLTFAHTGKILSADRISTFVKAIFNSSETEPRRLTCPGLNAGRYAALTQPQNNTQASEDADRIDFFFALDLRQCLSILPRLLGSIVEVVQFLGPQRCALSIVEGNSPDGTGDILVALRPYFEEIGLRYWYQESDLDPAKGERIQRLAALRNLALDPLIQNSKHATDKTTILFVNDVAACAEDLLELALQRRRLEADMTCAMDWTYVGPDPTFYDVWVARTIDGDSFFDIPSGGSWDSAWNLFWNAPATQSRYQAKLPFQVFSCWNGAVAVTATPVLEGLRFRAAHNGECWQGEPQVFAKELWFRGHGKIAVIPSVNLEYSNEKGAAIKELKGYTSKWVGDQDDGSYRIEWALQPPEKVRCMQNWDKQYWSPWNETLA
ncbi:Alpha-1,3-mannosyltransferase CMT1 [Paramyrothecium foliicola]|nr:Alpha-1,3-mannosyltransferase CMT1 [Paramyrothecium foliicola]